MGENLEYFKTVLLNYETVGGSGVLSSVKNDLLGKVKIIFPTHCEYIFYFVPLQFCKTVPQPACNPAGVLLTSSTSPTGASGFQCFAT